MGFLMETETEIKREWDRISATYFIYREDDEPLFGFRFETQDLNNHRYAWDRDNYTVGMWNAWVRIWGGTEHMTWPEGTSVEEIKEAILAKDIRATKPKASAVLSETERNTGK